MSKLTWKDIPENTPRSSGGNKTGESPYVDLKEGDNYVRVIDDETFYGVMMYYAYGKFQKSADEYLSKTSICPLAKELDDKGEPYKARPYFLFKAIERSSGKLKVLRVGKQLLDMMKVQSSKPKWGSLANYDLCITKRPKGQNPLYVISPEPQSPLSEDDLKLIKNDNINLENLSRPAKVEWVQEFIDKNKPGAQRSRTAARETAAPRTSAPQKPRAPASAPEVSDDFQDVSDTATAGEVSDDFDNIDL